MDGTALLLVDLQNEPVHPATRLTAGVPVVTTGQVLESDLAWLVDQ